MSEPLRGITNCWNASVVGSKLTMALLPQSLSQTVSCGSTQTAYAFGRPPGSFHSRHSPERGSYRATCPAFHSLTQIDPCESVHTRRAPWPGVGGSVGAPSE